MTSLTPRWLVICSCGWGRECISRWAAESGKAASETQRARNPAHSHDRGAAGRRPARDAAPADL